MLRRPAVLLRKVTSQWSSRRSTKTKVSLDTLKFVKFQRDGFGRIFLDQANQKRLRFIVRVLFVIGTLNTYLFLSEVRSRF